MINLGDGPYKKEATLQQIDELLEACILDYNITAKVIEVLDPESEAAQLAGSGMYIPELVQKAKKINVRIFKVVGRLHGWRFERAWYYWRARCEKSSAQIFNPDAMELWERHGDELRVAGHCGGIKPEPPWLADRFEVEEVPDPDDSSERLYEIRHDNQLICTAPFDEVEEKIRAIREELPEDKRHGGVESYHIDTQETLNAFAQYLIEREERNGS